MGIEGTGAQGPGRARTLLLGGAVLLVTALAYLPSDAAGSPGRIFQFGGARGCTTEAGVLGCATGRSLAGASSVAISPDGRNLYVASEVADSVTAFLRDRRSGRVVQLRELAGCVSASGLAACQTGRGLDGAFSVAVSPDGKNVYLASSRSVAVFAREGARGGLTQLPGGQGCLSTVPSPGCAVARGIDLASDVVVSPDGRHVYVTGTASDSVAVFDRNPTSGALTQPLGPSGCISDGGAGGCTAGRALDGAHSLTIGRRGGRVFVTSQTNDAVAVLTRDATTGALTQSIQFAGCVAASPGLGCLSARAIEDPAGVVVSPNGKSLYVASAVSNAVAVFAVAENGQLTQPSGKRGCLSVGGAGGCRPTPELASAFAITASEENRNVYVASRYAVTALRRNRAGHLRKVGCTSDGGVSRCATGRALQEVTGVVVSPDGRHVYATARDTASLVVFARDPQRGLVRVRIRGVPRGCARRPFLARLEIDSRLPVRRVRVMLDGVRLPSDRDATGVKVRPKRLNRGKYALSAWAKDVTGTRDIARRSFRRC